MTRVKGIVAMELRESTLSRVLREFNLYLWLERVPVCKDLEVHVTVSTLPQTRIRDNC